MRFKFVILFMFIGFCFVYFFQIGQYGFIAPGEPRYAEIASHMNENNDWVTPIFNSQVHLEKPPLVYWITAINFKIFGETEKSARMVSVLAGLLAAIITGLIARILFNSLVSLLSIILLLSSFSWPIFSRMLLTDIVSIFFNLCVFYFYLKNEQKTKFIFLAFLWGFLALGVMSRGMLSLVFPMGVITIYHWIYYRQIWINSRYHFYGIGLFLLLIIPWHILAEIENPGFLKIYLWDNHLQRFLGNYPPGGNHSLTLAQFWGIFLAGFFPWSFFVPILSWNFFKKLYRNQISKKHMFIWVWIVFVFIFLSISGAKLERYFLPILPPFAIMVAFFIYERIHLKQYYFIKLFYLTNLFIGLLLIGVLFIVPHWIPYVVEIKDLVLWISFCLLLSSIISLQLAIQQRGIHSLIVQWIGIVGVLLFILQVIIRLNPILSTKYMAQFIKNNYKNYNHIIVEKSYQYYEGIYFYSHQNVSILRKTDPLTEKIAKWDASLHPHIDYDAFYVQWSSVDSVLLVTKFSESWELLIEKYPDRVFILDIYDPYILVSNIPFNDEI